MKLLFRSVAVAAGATLGIIGAVAAVYAGVLAVDFIADRRPGDRLMRAYLDGARETRGFLNDSNPDTQ